MSNAKILVVDDDPFIVQLLQSKLQGAGYEVVTAADPSGAVTVARDSNPDLFILDINFPPDPTFNWDGFGVAEWLRHVGLTGERPVVFITADDMEKHRAHAAQFRPSALFHKPLDIDQLLAAVSHCLAAAPEPAA